MQNSNVSSELNENINPFFDNNADFAQYEKISETEHAVVFKVRKADRLYLLKCSPNNGLKNSNIALLKREYSILCKLNLTFVSRPISFYQDPTYGYGIVMEYIEGCTLDVFIRKNPSANERRRILGEILDALENIHHKQVVHGDIKPQNIMVSDLGKHVTIIDFGFSDFIGSVHKNIGFTKKNAAPEQLEQNYTIDERIDIYAIGNIVKLLFPFRYALVAKKCQKLSPSARYRNVRELNKALKRSDALSNIAMLFLCVAVIALALLFLRTPELENDTKNAIIPEVVKTETIADTVKNDIETKTEKPKEKEFDIKQLCHNKYLKFKKIARDSISYGMSNEMTLDYAKELNGVRDSLMKKYPEKIDEILLEYEPNYVFYMEKLSLENAQFYHEQKFDKDSVESK